MLQLRIEGSTSRGMVMTLVTVSSANGGMTSPTSFKRSSVWTLLFPLAKKLCFLYKQYLGLISRDELFLMKATTFNPSSAIQSRKVKPDLCFRQILVSITCTPFTLSESHFFKIDIHGYTSWGKNFHFLILRLMLRCLKEKQECSTNALKFSKNRDILILVDFSHIDLKAKPVALSSKIMFGAFENQCFHKVSTLNANTETSCSIHV